MSSLFEVVGEPPSKLKYKVIINSEKYREGKMKRFSKDFFKKRLKDFLKLCEKDL